MTDSTDCLPFALPDLDGAELTEIKEALDSGWITTGPKTHRFEEAFAAYVGAAHAVAVNSGTAAMHLALEAIGLRRGDLVLTTPYTFAATAEVIRYFDAVPVFIDIDPKTFNMDVAQLAQAVQDLCVGGRAAHRWLPPTLRNPQCPKRRGTLSATCIESSRSIRNPKSIIPVHIAGLPADLDAIYPIAAQHNLAVVEDEAHALAAQYNGQMIGSPNPQCPKRRGTLSATCTERQPRVASRSIPNPQFVCFSFYATKALTTGEGGMICTDDAELAERCRIMALHGISKDAWKRYTAEGSWYYEIIAPGYKYNMTDVAAAMGLAQLVKVERMWRRRREIAGRYNEAFKAMPELQVPHDRPDCQHAWHLYMLRLNLERLRIDRARFIEELKGRKIGTSVHFIPLHLHPYYRDTYGYRPEDFPVAWREYQREVSLPIYSRMSDADVQRVIEAVQETVQAHRAWGFLEKPGTGGNA